jgi:hypothetical protein
MSVIPELNKGAGVDCVFCKKGCTIYGKHPSSCKEFECAWLQKTDNFSSEEARNEYMELRPDKSGIMFFKKSRDIMTGAVIDPDKITDKGKQQISAFHGQGFSVVLIKVGERPIVIPKQGSSKEEVFSNYVNILEHGNV